MNNSEILKSAIEKAQKNGWKPFYRSDDIQLEKIENGIVYISYYQGEIEQRIDYTFGTMDIIVSFAKAFFGERDVCGCCGKLWKEHGCYYGGGHPLSKPEPIWRHQLAIMAGYRDDPIKYLEQFL